MDKGIKLFKIEIYGADKHEKTWMLLVIKKIFAATNDNKVLFFLLTFYELGLKLALKFDPYIYQMSWIWINQVDKRVGVWKEGTLEVGSSTIVSRDTCKGQHSWSLQCKREENCVEWGKVSRKGQDHGGYWVGNGEDLCLYPDDDQDFYSRNASQIRDFGRRPWLCRQGEAEDRKSTQGDPVRWESLNPAKEEEQQRRAKSNSFCSTPLWIYSCNLWYTLTFKGKCHQGHT